MRAAGDTVQQYNERQAARYAGLMFEEFGEFVAELGYSGLSQELKDIGSDYKAGKMDYTIGEAVAHKAVPEAADNVGGDWPSSRWAFTPTSRSSSLQSPISARSATTAWCCATQTARSRSPKAGSRPT